MKKLLLASAFFAALAGSASAYTAYLMPDEFLPDERSIALQAAYATTFFTPALAVGAEFAVVQPDGSDGYYNRIEVQGAATRLTGSLQLEGTYRFTTGERVGRVATMVAVDGAWRELRDGEAPPEDAEINTLQTITVADAYVTLGRPNRAAIDAPGGRLALRPITHPNQVLASQGFQVQATFNGAPFANAALVLYRPGEPETDLDRYVATDANGIATLMLEGPGQYLLVARHRADAPPGSEARVQSFTTSLAFEAFEALPPVVRVAEPVQNQRRRRPIGR